MLSEINFKILSICSRISLFFPLLNKLSNIDSLITPFFNVPLKNSSNPKAELSTSPFSSKGISTFPYFLAF